MIKEIAKNFEEKIKNILTRIDELGAEIKFNPKENKLEITMDYYDYQKLKSELISTINFRCDYIGPKLVNSGWGYGVDKKITIAKHNLGEFKFILRNY